MAQRTHHRRALSAGSIDRSGRTNLTSECPMLRLQAEYLALRTKHPFIIARGGQSDYRTVWVKITDADGHEGWGEAAPTKFYGETAETVMESLQVYATQLPAD